MITLYRRANHPEGIAIETKLKDLLAAHRVVTIQPGENPENLGSDTPLPAIVENDQVVAGEAAITGFLKQLKKDLDRWSFFQMDACYIWEDEEDIC